MGKYTNINEVLKELSKFGNEADKVIDEDMASIASEISVDAKRLARYNFGKLRQSISFERKKPKQYKVFASAPYAAYMEHGS